MLRTMDFTPQVSTVDNESDSESNNKNNWRKRAGALLASTVIFATGCQPNADSEVNTAPAPRPTIDFGGSSPTPDTGTSEKTKESGNKNGTIYDVCGTDTRPRWSEGNATTYPISGCTELDVKNMLVKGLGFSDKEVTFINFIPGGVTVYPDNSREVSHDSLVSTIIKDGCEISAGGDLVVGQPVNLQASYDVKNNRRAMSMIGSAKDAKEKILPKCVTKN